MQNHQNNSIIDLSGQVSPTTQNTKKHRGMVISTLLCFLGWILLFSVFYFLGQSYSESGESDYLPVLLVTTMILGILGLIIVSVIASSIYKGLLSTFPKRVMVTQYFVSIITPSLINVFCFAQCSDYIVGSLVQVVTFIFIIPLSLYYLIMTLFMANQANTKDMLNALIAYFIGISLSGIIGHLLILLLSKVVIGLLILVVMIVLFFFTGGGFIYIRKD